MSETKDVVAPTLKALAKLPGVWAMRVHSGSARGGKQQLAPDGTPDMFAVVRGTPIFFEAKSAGKAPSVAQGMQHDRLRRAGAEVHVVFSVGQALDVVRRILEVRR